MHFGGKRVLSIFHICMVPYLHGLHCKYFPYLHTCLNKRFRLSGLNALILFYLSHYRSYNRFDQLRTCNFGYPTYTSLHQLSRILTPYNINTYLVSQRVQMMEGLRHFELNRIRSIVM